MASSAEPLQGRMALVTGASRGIGRVIAERFALSGMSVVVVARSEVALRQLADETGAQPLLADLSSADDVERMAGQLGQAPDVVVHAAGAFELSGIESATVESFDRQMDVNARAAFLLMRALVPGMRRRGSGHFVSIGSVAGRNAFPANGAYAASKFALRALHAVLHAELRGSGVRATLIEPAATDTDLWESVDRDAHPGLPERSAMLDPDAVAAAVLYAVTQPRTVAVQNVIMERA